MKSHFPKVYLTLAHKILEVCSLNNSDSFLKCVMKPVLEVLFCKYSFRSVNLQICCDISYTVCVQRFARKKCEFHARTLWDDNKIRYNAFWESSCLLLRGGFCQRRYDSVRCGASAKCNQITIRLLSYCPGSHLVLSPKTITFRRKNFHKKRKFKVVWNKKFFCLDQHHTDHRECECH